MSMMLVTSLLAGGAWGSCKFFFILMAKEIAIIGLVIVSAKWIVLHVLFQIAQTRSREIFVLSIVVTCLSEAWITSRAGLSL